MATIRYATLREKIAAESVIRSSRNVDFARWIVEAHAAGIAAGNGAAVVPMVVSEHENMMDDNSPVRKQWFVGDGVCGFAWVTVRPGNCAFALWAKKNDGWRSAYGGGTQKWIHEFGQSMQRKEDYAYAYAAVLAAHGIGASAGSRMD